MRILLVFFASTLQHDKAYPARGPIGLLLLLYWFPALATATEAPIKQSERADYAVSGGGCRYIRARVAVPLMSWRWLRVSFSHCTACIARHADVTARRSSPAVALFVRLVFAFLRFACVHDVSFCRCRCPLPLPLPFVVCCC